MSQRIFHLYFRHSLTLCIFFPSFYTSHYSGLALLLSGAWWRAQRGWQNLSQCIAIMCFEHMVPELRQKLRIKYTSKTTEGGISIIWIFLVFRAGAGTFFFHFGDTVPTARGRAQAATSVTLNRLCSRTQKDVCASHGKRLTKRHEEWAPERTVRETNLN